MDKIKKTTKKIGPYEIMMNEIIGCGAFGKVFYARKPNDNKTYAAKMIALKDLEGNKLLDREMHPLIFEHANIVKYYDSYQTKSNLYIFMEFCEGGDLLEIMKKIKKNKINENHALQFIYPISLALNYLYKTHKIIHRDVKPANILLQKGIPKLTDFGFSTVENLTQTNRIGTKRYMAPEVFLNQSYDYKCDVWSFGMMLYELLYSYFPWTGKDIEQIFKKCTTKPLEFDETENVSESTKNLLKKMLCVSVENRSGWDEIIFNIKWILYTKNKANDMILFLKEINSIIKLLTRNWEELSLKIEEYYSTLILLYKFEIFIMEKLIEYHPNKLDDEFDIIFDEEKQNLNFISEFLKKNDNKLYKNEIVKIKIDVDHFEIFKNLRLMVGIIVKKVYDNFKKNNFGAMNESNLFCCLTLVYFLEFLRYFDEEEKIKRINYISKAKKKLREELINELIELHEK